MLSKFLLVSDFEIPKKGKFKGIFSTEDYFLAYVTDKKRNITSSPTPSNLVLYDATDIQLMVIE